MKEGGRREETRVGESICSGRAGDPVTCDPVTCGQDQTCGSAKPLSLPLSETCRRPITLQDQWPWMPHANASDPDHHCACHCQRLACSIAHSPLIPGRVLCKLRAALQGARSPGSHRGSQISQITGPRADWRMRPLARDPIRAAGSALPVEIAPSLPLFTSFLPPTHLSKSCLQVYPPTLIL
jgi:hypothetical protein